MAAGMIWVVWQYEDYECCSLIEAFSTKEESINKAMSELRGGRGDTPSIADEGKDGEWHAWHQHGSAVMAPPIHLARRDRKAEK